MAQETRPKAPGLKWRARANGPEVPYWFASAAAIRSEYPVKAVNLSAYANDHRVLLDRAQRLQFEMTEWLAGRRTYEPEFNGTFKSLLEFYQRDPDSPFKALKYSSAQPYEVYLRKMIKTIGSLRIDDCDGRTVKRWFKAWRSDPDKPEVDKLAAARMSIAALKSAVRFGTACRLSGCREFQDVLKECIFEVLSRRTQAPTADQIIAARQAAHAAGYPLRALAYAIQFETSLRQWDVIGQWLPLYDPRPSSVLFGRQKWVGPTWAQIDRNMILAKIKPSKTEGSSDIDVSFDLSVCPMVMEEIATVPIGQRVGPLIINEGTGRPYSHPRFRQSWREDFLAAGLPANIWNRDLRAGSITEGGKAGSSMDDRRKLAGHTTEYTTEVYDREVLEAHRRDMNLRKAFRDKNGA